MGAEHDVGHSDRLISPIAVVENLSSKYIAEGGLARSLVWLVWLFSLALFNLSNLRNLWIAICPSVTSVPWSGKGLNCYPISHGEITLRAERIGSKLTLDFFEDWINGIKGRMDPAFFLWRNGESEMMETKTRKLRLRSLYTGLLPLFVLGHFAHHLLTALPVPLLPMIRSAFDLDYKSSGLVVSAFTLSWGLSQLPAGWLADRIGRPILLTMGISGVAVAGLFVGLSRTFPMLIFFLILMGVMGGGYHPASPPLISALVEPKHRGRALGLHLIGGSASYFLSPLAAMAIAGFWGWYAPFIGLSIPTILFGFAFHVLLTRQLNRIPKETAAAGTRHEPAARTGSVRRLVVFLVLTTFNASFVMATVSFIPLYLVDQHGVGNRTAAGLISLIFSAGLWAAPLGGILSDRFGRIPVMLTICFISGPMIYLLKVLPYGVTLYALLLLFGMCIYFRMAVSESYIVSQTSESHRSAVLGIYYFTAIEGSGLINPLIGHLIDRLGFSTTFTISCVTLLTATLICSFWLLRRQD